MDLSSRLAALQERIAVACRRSGRSMDTVELMAVTKNHDAATVAAAYAVGLRLFGENRVQEAREKYPLAASAARIHLIGSLQRNKAKYAVALFDRIESVDRVELIVELAKRADEQDKIQELLLELHTGEESKAGFPDEDSLLRGVELALKAPSLRIRGLMTMAPYTEDAAAVRRAFRRLARLRESVAARFPEADWSTLSMGMTADFETAIEEGSTQIRLGTALFGAPA